MKEYLKTQERKFKLGKGNPLKLNLLIKRNEEKGYHDEGILIEQIFHFSNYCRMDSLRFSLRFLDFFTLFLVTLQSLPGLAYMFNGFNSFKHMYLLKQIWAPH